MAVLARSASRVVAGRVTNATARALGQYCSDNRCTQSEALRKALVILSASIDDPEATLSAVAVAIGLAPDASGDEVQAAIADLMTQIDGGSNAEPDAEAPDPVPPPPGTFPPPAKSTLTNDVPGRPGPKRSGVYSDAVEARLKQIGMSRAQYEKAMAAMPRAPSKPQQKAK